jgi:putative ABC transport system substrate-binding protein
MVLKYSTLDRKSQRSGTRTRRAFVRELTATSVAAALLAGCGVGLPQPVGSPRVRRIGFLSSNVWQAEEIFRGRLRELGYVEGRDITIEWRFADNTVERLPELAAELVRLPVDVLVALATPAARAAKAATSSIPIVFVLVNDPVGQGLVESLARPGGNVTGFSTLSSAISGRRIELLKAVVPELTRVAVFWNATNAGMRLALQETEDAARQMGVHVVAFGLRDLEDVGGALDTAREQQAEGFVVLPAIDPRMHAAIVDFAGLHHIPNVSSNDTAPRDGSLMRLGPNYDELRRGAAGYVDRILRGTNAGDLPVEQPSKFDLVINLTNADALGISIPRHVLLQATEVVR